MNVLAAPAGGSAVIEPRLEVRIEIGRPHPASEMERDTRHPIAAKGRFPSDERLNLLRQRLCHPLVCVEGKDPVVPRKACGVVLLIDPTGPLTGADARAFAPGNL